VNTYELSPEPNAALVRDVRSVHPDSEYLLTNFSTTHPRFSRLPGRLPLVYPSKYVGSHVSTLYSTGPAGDETGVLGVVGELTGGGGGGELTGGGGGGELVVQKFVLTPPVRIPSSIRAKKAQLMIRSKLMITRMHRPTPIV